MAGATHPAQGPDMAAGVLGCPPRAVGRWQQLGCTQLWRSAIGEGVWTAHSAPAPLAAANEEGARRRGKGHRPPLRAQHPCSWGLQPHGPPCCLHRCRAQRPALLLAVLLSPLCLSPRCATPAWVQKHQRGKKGAEGRWGKVTYQGGWLLLSPKRSLQEAQEEQQFLTGCQAR